VARQGFAVPQHVVMRWSLEMSKIVNTEVWELFTGKQVAISEREDFNRSDHDSNTTVDLRSSNRITWREFETFKDFVANVPKSSPYGLTSKM
jgi:hypothetical protein